MDNVVSDQILKQFVKRAPETKKYIKQLKSPLILNPQHQPPFSYLIRAITYQQLSGKAANTIYNRFLVKVGKLTPENVLKLKFEELKSCGLSRQKSSYIQNVAEAFSPQGFLSHLATLDELDTLQSKEILEQFTQIKGVGEWTVHMFLIFSLGRLDILAPADLGIKKGVQQIYGLDELPTPGIAKKTVAHWGDLSTVGCLLCYELVDGGMD